MASQYQIWLCNNNSNREASVNIVHSWMREHNVEPVGRFGLWEYLWSDQAIKSGKKLIESKFFVTPKSQ